MTCLISFSFLYSTAGEKWSTTIHLSDDKEAKVNDNSVPQLPIQQSTFKSKLWRMGKKLSQVGGMKRLQLIKEWKDSDWPFKINAGDVNSELVHRMRCFKKDLEKENLYTCFRTSHSRIYQTFMGIFASLANKDLRCNNAALFTRYESSEPQSKPRQVMQKRNFPAEESMILNI